MSQERRTETLLDRAHLDAQTGGDAALQAELLTLFREQCGRLMPGIADPDRPRAERADLAHTLKGSALAIGAGSVAARAAALEDGLRRRAGVPPASADLAAVVAATLSEIARDV